MKQSKMALAHRATELAGAERRVKTAELVALYKYSYACNAVKKTRVGHIVGEEPEGLELTYATREQAFLRQHGVDAPIND